MFASDSFLISQVYDQSKASRALQQYRMARVRGQLNHLWSALTGRSRSLHRLPKTTAGGQRFAGLQAVPLRQIRGTEGRTDDFDRDFNPLTDHTRARWLSVFTAWEKDVALPPVELIGVGETYFVRDGHHRISVARALGQDYIERVVTVRE
jgi:hypothetical protein